MSRESTIAIAKQHLDRGDALGWFEAVYQHHRADTREIPWADFAPNDLLVSWLEANAVSGRAAVVGCGLGDDAAECARRGMSTLGFDLSPTAVELARERFGSVKQLSFEAADVLALPEAWIEMFDFVFEAYTLQSLPLELRGRAFASVARLVAHGGTLVVVARLRDDTTPAPETPPWPLTRGELAAPEGMTLVAFEEHPPSDQHPALRVRAVYRR